MFAYLGCNEMGGEYSAMKVPSMVQYTLSACENAEQFSKNLTASEATSSRLVEVCISRQLAEYLNDPSLHPMVRLQIVDIAQASSKGAQKSIHSQLLIAAVGRRTYDKFLAAAYELEELGVMVINQSYCPSYHNKSGQVVGWTKTYSISQSTEQSHSAQHYITGAAADLGIWLVVDLGLLDESLRFGRLKLNWLSVEATKASLVQVTLDNVPDTDVVLRKRAEEHIKANTPRIKPEKLAVKVERQVAIIRKAEQKPDGGKIKRKSGRIYHRLSNLPKWARQLYVRICGEVPVNVDIRACYFWCLLADLRRRRMAFGLPVDRLESMLDMVESGQFYERLATLAGMSTRGAKAGFATLCLFGGIDEHFGNNRLWYALKELCPSICREILRLRERHGGASGFAKHCQRMEGAIMLDGLLMTLHEMGIPCIGLHDGALVQPEHRQMAINIIKARSFELFGRSCHVSG